MKKIYFVRHGESEGNAGTTLQDSFSPLTNKGRKQAELVAKRFKGIKIDKILASPQIRAKSTAEIINQVLQKSDIEFSDLLKERSWPSALIGKPRNGPETIAIESLIHSNIHNLNWRHSDEENFLDLKERALKLLKHIDSLKEENILLVSHGIFLRMFTAIVLLGPELTSHEWWDFFCNTSTNNTGVSVFAEFKFRDESPHWQLVSWNDHAHLGEIK